MSLSLQTILGEIRDEEDEILPRKDYEVRNYHYEKDRVAVAGKNES